MKKLSILFLTILLLAGMTGCGNKAANNPITLTMWHVYGSQTESPLNTMIEQRAKKTAFLFLLYPSQIPAPLTMP